MREGDGEEDVRDENARSDLNECEKEEKDGGFILEDICTYNSVIDNAFSSYDQSDCRENNSSKGS